MQNRKRILSEAVQMKALASTLLNCASNLEKLLTGEGKRPVGTRKGNVDALVAKALTKRNKTIQKRKSTATNSAL